MEKEVQYQKKILQLEMRNILLAQQMLALSSNAQIAIASSKEYMQKVLDSVPKKPEVQGWVREENSRTITQMDDLIEAGVKQRREINQLAGELNV